MEKIYKELDEVKAEVEKLKEECRIKTEMSESLKKAHNEQLAKFQEAKLQIEKMVQQLNDKSEEISEVKQFCHELKLSLQEKESLVKHLSTANERLRVEYGEKIQKLEGGNKNSVLALDEATARIQVLEKKIYASDEEIEGLKRLLTTKQKKCFEVEQQVQVSRELKQRDDVILELEEAIRSSEDKLRWKTEQFELLEEAHRRLQDQFRSSKVEWQTEKSTLLEEVSSLETRLDSQTRISENLQTQLRMCNQALANEESRRKILELELSDFKSHFENVFLECQYANSKIEDLTLKRNEEITTLRNSLGTRETLLKEMERRTIYLEQENQELHASLKEFQEAQINNADATYLLKELQNKLQNLEKLHSKCSINLKEKEAQLNSQIKKLTEDIKCCLSELSGKSKQVQELKEKLESCLMEVQIEENSILNIVLKSEFSAAYSKLFSEKGELELSNKESEEQILLLTEQMEAKNSALRKLRADLECFKDRAKFFDVMQQEQYLLKEQVGRHRKKLEKLYESQLHLKKQVLQIKNVLEEDIKEISDAFEKAIAELAKKTAKAGETELELQKWKYVAEGLKAELEETQEAYKQENEILLGMVKKQDEEISNLQQQIVILELGIATKAEEVETIKQEKENYLQITEEKDACVKNLLSEIGWLKESAKREMEARALAQLDAQKASEQEKESFLSIIKDKEQRIFGLSARAKSMELDLTNLIISFAEKQVVIDVLGEALEGDDDLKNIAIGEKNNTIAKLEMDVNDLHQRLKLQEMLLFQSNQETEQLKASLQANKSEIEELKVQFSNERRHLELLIKELEFKKRDLHDSITKLSLDWESLLSQVEEINEKIGLFSGKDVELMVMLENILQRPEQETELPKKLALNDEPWKSGNRVAGTSFSSSRKGIEEIDDNRSPLAELNH